jgi:5-methylcytosine-specific restriction endonuclease McrA
MAARGREYYRAHRSECIARATITTRERRKHPEVREKERISSREAKRRQLADPVEYEKHLERGRRWRAENPEKAKKFKHEQPEMKAARNLRRNEKFRATPEGRARLNAQAQKWRAANREKARTTVRRRRARLLKAVGSHTESDVLAQLEKQGHLCFWCATDISDDSHVVDHYVPLVKGGTDGPENIVGACRSCNCRKWALDPDEFRKRLIRSGVIVPPAE